MFNPDIAGTPSASSSSLAQYAADNIKHKGSLASFVTAPMIALLGKMAEVAPMSSWDAIFSSAVAEASTAHAAKRRRLGLPPG